MEKKKKKKKCHILNAVKDFDLASTEMYAIWCSTGNLFNQLMKDDPSTVKGAEALMLGEMLTLPQNFG